MMPKEYYQKLEKVKRELAEAREVIADFQEEAAERRRDRWEDPYRGTGRTTGLMLQTIGRAMLQPGDRVLFRDHHDNDQDAAIKHYRLARELVHLLQVGDRFTVTIDGCLVYLTSDLMPRCR